MKQHYFILLFIFGLMTSCLKDEYVVIEEEIIQPPVVSYIKSSVQGVVFDKYGSPMPDVEVRIGSVFQHSDPQGRYCFSSVPIAEEGEVIRFNKSGLAESYAFLKPELNELMTLSNQMVEPSGTYKFQKSDEIIIPFGNDGLVEIPADAFQYEDGRNVDSDILIESIFYENLCNANCYPVNLDINTQGQYRLKTDMIIGLNVVSSSSNEKLILKEGFDISLIFPTNQALSNDMNLYQFDKQTLRWSEQNNVEIISNRKYILHEIPDFISVGYSKAYTWITGDLKDIFGSQHYKNYGVLTTDKRSVFDHVLTSSSGHFEIAWPINEPLELHVINECNELSYFEAIPAISSGTFELGEIDMKRQGRKAVIKGLALDINNEPIKNGVVKIIPKFGWPYYANIDPSNGNYLTYLQTCRTNEFDIVLYDIDEMRVHEIDNAYIRTGGRANYKCKVTNQMTDYLMIKFDQNTYVLENPAFKIEGNKVSISYSPGLDNLMEAWVSLSLPELQEGNYNNGELSFLSFDQNECEVFFNHNNKNGVAQFSINSVPDSMNNTMKGEATILNYIDVEGKSHDIYIKYSIAM